jgi:hypothetical protein
MRFSFRVFIEELPKNLVCGDTRVKVQIWIKGDRAGHIERFQIPDIQPSDKATLQSIVTWRAAVCAAEAEFAGVAVAVTV